MSSLREEKREKDRSYTAIKVIVKSYLGTTRILQVPKLDVSVTYGNKIIAIFREADGLYFARNFVGCYFYVASPIPDVDNHVVLRTDRYNVLVAW